MASSKTKDSNPLPWREAASLIIVTRASVPQIVGSNLSENMIATSRVLPTSKPSFSSSSPSLPSSTILTPSSSSVPNTQLVACKSNSRTQILPRSVDYRLLMVKRSNIASFLASAFVFPGGKVDASDYSSQWWSIFCDTCSLNQSQLVDSIRSRTKGPRPPMITSPLTMPVPTKLDLQSPLPPDLSLRITAIRETFEETGVLLLTNSPNKTNSNGSLTNNDLSPIELSEWREKVHSNGSNFIELCRFLKQSPDIWSLYEWWDWLTPKSVGHRRFDTMFYVCCLDKQPNVVVDNKEVTTLKWCSPLEMLTEHAEGNIFLAPPQVYELSRLQHLPNFKSVRSFVSTRETLGVERWLPVISTFNDGALSLLPGDDSYPNEPDYTGTDPVEDNDGLLVESRSKCVKFNRLELHGPICSCLVNIQLSCGHLTPISLESLAPSMKSML